MKIKNELLELDVNDLFNLSVDERKRLIEIAADVLIDQVLFLSYRQEKTFIKTLNEVLAQIDFNLSVERQKENYELCYYYEELMWGVKRKMEEIKNIK